MEKENFLIYDENVSLEATILEGEVCRIKMYYNPFSDDYISIKLDKDNLNMLIEHLVLIEKSL